MAEFFPDVAGPIPFGGLDSSDPLTFKVYQPDRLSSASGWRTTSGSASACGTRSAGRARTSSARARSTGRGSSPAWTRWPRRATELDAAFEFFAKLGVPFYCFHDRDVAPEGRTFAETQANLDEVVGHDRQPHGADRACASCGARPTCSATRATRPAPRRIPIPRSSPTPRPRSSSMLEATHRLGGANYVLWGGREGYDTLLNTDLVREEDQLARFLDLVAEHKHRIGFSGTLLIEPKPQEPTKHQYDYDVGDGPRLPRAPQARGRVQAQHRGQPRDPGRPQLPSRGRPTRSATASSAASTPTAATTRTAGTPTSSRTRSTSCRLAVYEILRAGGLTTGGFNFDTKLRRQSMDRDDLFHAHIGGIDTLAQALARGGGDDRGRRARAAARRALRGLGRRARPVDPRSATRRSRRSSAGSVDGRDRPEAGVRSPGAARERGQPGRSGRPAARPRVQGRAAELGPERMASSWVSTSRRPRRRRS